MFHFNLATIFQSLHLYDKAYACYQRAIALQPGLAEAHNNLGNICRELGRLPEAIGCFQRAVSLKPDFAEALNNLGNIYSELENPEHAEVWRNKVLTHGAQYSVEKSQ